MIEPTSKPEFDRTSFRKVLGTFPTGVTVLTTVNAAGVVHGLTANSFSSVSLDPPLILICLDRSSNSLIALRESGVFAINVLSEDQKEISNVFASKVANKFDGVEWGIAKTGSPIFPGTIGWIDCSVHEIVSAGDHDIVIGLVKDYGQSSARPLGYFRGGYTLVSLEQQALISPGTAVFSAIVEYDNRILLQRTSEGMWSFPEAKSGPSDVPLGGLCQMLADVGAPTVLNFLYSVAQLPDKRGLSILYRGQLLSPPKILDTSNWVFVNEIDVPWKSLLSYETEMTLRRYFRERKQDRFGIFADIGDGGRLISVDREGADYSRDIAERVLR